MRGSSLVDRVHLQEATSTGKVVFSRFSLVALAIGGSDNLWLGNCCTGTAGLRCRLIAVGIEAIETSITLMILGGDY